MVRARPPKELVDAHQLKTVSLVAKAFGATARQESEGWIAIVEDGEVTCYLNSEMTVLARPFFVTTRKKGGEGHLRESVLRGSRTEQNPGRTEALKCGPGVWSTRTMQEQQNPSTDARSIARLTDAGAHLVLCRPDKRPVWRGWQKRRPSAAVAQMHVDDAHGPVGRRPVVAALDGARH